MKRWAVWAQACSKPVECHALVLWFDTEFSSRFCKERSIMLSTSPHSPQTHWAQTVITLRHPIMLYATAAASGSAAEHAGHKAAPEGIASSVHGRISFARSQTHRCLDISVECQGFAADGSAVGVPQVQLSAVATT